jgi:hypothetical protein
LERQPYPGLYRAEGQVELTGNLSMSVVFIERQMDDAALFFRQVAQRGLDVLRLLAGKYNIFGRSVWIGHQRRIVGVELGPLFLSESIDA